MLSVCVAALSQVDDKRTGVKKWVGVCHFPEPGRRFTFFPAPGAKVAAGVNLVTGLHEAGAFKSPEDGSVIKYQKLTGVSRSMSLAEAEEAFNKLSKSLGL